MADGNIGPKIVLEGEKQYRQAIRDINKDMRVLSSELKSTSAEFDGNANSIDALRKKNDILNREYDEQVLKIRTLQGALEKAEETYGENSNQVKDWQIKLNNANAELSKLDKEIKINEKYLDEAKKSTDGTAKSIDAYGKEVKQAEVSTEDFNKELDKVKGGLSSFAKGTVGAIGGISAALIGVTEGTKEYRRDLSRLSQNANTAGTSLDNVSGELKKLDAITGETDSNVEALSNLLATGFSGNNLTKAVDMLSGAVIKFPDTLKIEGLADGLQETLATGQAIGPFSELLERLGYNLDDFNNGLSKCTTEAQKQQYAIDYLSKSGLSDINRQYRENNKELIEYNESQFELRQTMAEVADRIAPSMNRIMSKLADGIDDVAEGGLPLLVSGLEWVVDNGDIVIGAISGIAVGMTAFKVATFGVELATSAWNSYQLATKGATTAQNLLNASQAANPIMLVASLIGIAATGLVTYAINTKSASNETNKLNDETKALNKEINENIKSRKENRENIELERTTTLRLADELYNLADKEKKSNIEKERMKELVYQLNQAIPDLNLSIDENTWSVNKNENAVNKLINANYDLLKVESAMEELQKIADEKFKAEVQLNKALKEQKDIKEKIIEADNRQSGLSEYQATKRFQDQQTLNKQLEDTNKTIQESEQIIAELGIEFDLVSKTANDFGTTSTIATEKARESAEELSKQYNEMYESAEDSIRSQIGLFDEFDSKVDMSRKKMIENLQSQVEGVRKWSDNLRDLSKKGIDEGLLKELYEMGPQGAGYIQLLNDMSDEELSEFVGLWNQVGVEVGNAAKDFMKDTNSTVTNEFNKLQKEMALQGKLVARGFANGFDSGKYKIFETVDGAVKSVITRSKNVLQIKSPSRVFKEIGKYTAEGFGLGFVDEMKVETEKITRSIPKELEMKGSYGLNGNKSSNNLDAITLNFYPKTMTESELDMAVNYVNTKLGALL